MQIAFVEGLNNLLKVPIKGSVMGMVELRVVPSIVIGK